jgi:hypothetical protein
MGTLTALFIFWSILVIGYWCFIASVLDEMDKH